MGTLAARLTTPEPGQRVLEPRTGTTPLIGLPVDLFDPAATATECCAGLARDGVPRQRRLSAAEREEETGFAEWVQTRVQDAVDAALRLAEAVGTAEQPVFEVDGMKRLVPEYGAAGKPASPDEFRFRLAHNHALHPTAVALARLAFLRRLDELATLPDGHGLKQVFVTNGGCAAGKGSLTKIVKDALGDKATFGAVWDAAGEGDALENAWILEDFVRQGRAEGKDPGPVARAAISNAIKFLDIQPAEVRQAVLASHARIFGGTEP